LIFKAVSQIIQKEFLNNIKKTTIDMKYFFYLTLVALSFSACNIIDATWVKGNNKNQTKVFHFENFKSIDAGSNFSVYLKQDSAYTVKLETDENLISYIKIQNEDGTLIIRTKNGVNLRPSDEIKLSISMPSADLLEISGASKLVTDSKFIQDSELKIDLSGASTGNVSVRAPKINMESSGASTLTIDGETKDIFAKASGASTINGFNLKSENTEVEASGASNAKVFASISLVADASGASGIRYKGNPKVTSNSSGASTVKKED
jgi:hypothetical protein